MNEKERNDAANPAAEGASQQRAESGRHTDFPAASPESNVNPPGAPQSSRGSATEPVPGGAEGAPAAGGDPDTRQGVLTPDATAATADRSESRRDG